MASVRPQVQIFSQSPSADSRGGPATPSRDRAATMSVGLTMAQKQALIDNLQLEGMFPCPALYERTAVC